jgi:hypothetical protein
MHRVLYFLPIFLFVCLLDWTYQKIEEQRGKPKRDYATANTEPKQVLLTSVWATIVLVFLNSFIMDCLAGKYPVKKLF